MIQDESGFFPNTTNSGNNNHDRIHSARNAYNCDLYCCFFHNGVWYSGLSQLRVHYQNIFFNVKFNIIL